MPHALPAPCAGRPVALGPAAICLAAICLTAVAVVASAAPPRIIFDTDMTGDVDDVLALAMCHTLADRGACTLLGVTISKHHPQTAAFVDAVNTFYGRPDLPIGVTRDPAAQHRDSRYLALVEGAAFPNDLATNDDAHDAVALLRELLAASGDDGVTLVSVGTATNLAGLLRSTGDGHSPLGGVDLVRRHVRLLSIMAGAFQTVGGDTRHLEANVVNDIPSMRFVAAEWPEEVPVAWSGFEIGLALPYPRRSVADDFRVPTPHIVREAYLLHSGPDHDRPCWDQSSVLQAVLPDRGFFGLSPAGRVVVAADGATEFVPARSPPAGAPPPGSRVSRRDRFLTMSPAQQARALEAIVQLTSQPPRHGREIARQTGRLDGLGPVGP
jgi:purine nucleosidase